MKAREIQQFVERFPFRRFAVRLSNGATYEFEKARDLGVTKDLSTLVYFGDQGGLVLINAENIVEIIDPKKA